MSARRLLGLVETMLVEANGREKVDEWYADPGLNDLATRRRENALAVLAAGGEVA